MRAAPYAAVFSLLLLLSLGAAAVSPQDAKDYILNQTHFLEKNESIESYKDLPVTAFNEKYWVFTILSKGSPNGFIAVKFNELEVNMERKSNRELFQAMYVLRQLGKYRESLQGGSGWFFVKSNSKYFGNLASVLGNEKFELESAANELESLEASMLVSEMKVLLDGMIDVSGELREKMDEAIAFEQSFTNAPDANETGKLKQKYDEVFSGMEELDEKRQGYDSKSIELRQRIASSSLESTTKRSLFDLVNAPPEYNSIESTASQTANLEQGIGNIYLTAKTSIEQWLGNLDSDRQMNDAWMLLYGEDEAMKKASNGSFSTIKSAANFILSSENRGKWAESETVALLEKDLEAAEKAFSQKRFAEVETYAKKMRSEIRQILEGKFAPQNPNPFDSNLLINAVIYLVILLIALIAIKNRAKIFGGKRKDEGVDYFEP